MCLNFWVIVIWMVVSFVVGTSNKKRNDFRVKETSKEQRTQVIDAAYDSVPVNYCSGCGPKWSWED